MFSTVMSATLKGLCVEFVEVETDVSNGLPVFHMIGYLSSEVKEASERVRTAIRNIGIVLPAKKIVVNLSPASMRKQGTMFDLPIAVSILLSLGIIQDNYLKGTLFVGELSLDGTVKAIKGVLPIVYEAKQRGFRRCIVPIENEKEGGLVEGIQVIGVQSLQQVQELLCRERFPIVSESQSNINMPAQATYGEDYQDIKGQKLAKRAIEIAVAGNHNLLMVGAPGAGKSMLAQRIPTILPPLSPEESLNLSMIYSIVGDLDHNEPLMIKRPFREVHHSVTKTALIGGGRCPRPGEISLAHNGVLFLDEIAEFQKSTIEFLRQPLEEHTICILREKGEYHFPANFLLVAAMNPCPCGYYPDFQKCMCTGTQIRSYLGKISQPILDRIDMCIEVEKVEYQDLLENTQEETSADIRARVIKARQIQTKRYQEMRFTTNSQLTSKELELYCRLGKQESTLMKQAFENMGLTARRYYKVLGVARTIADLEGAQDISVEHLREALSYRMLDTKLWGGNIR